MVITINTPRKPKNIQIPLICLTAVSLSTPYSNHDLIKVFALHLVITYLWSLWMTFEKTCLIKWIWLILSVMPFNLFCSEREVFKGSKHTYYSWHNNLKLTFPNFPISLPSNFQKIIYSKISFHLTAKWATFRVYILHIQKKIYRIFRTIRCTRP